MSSAIRAFSAVLVVALGFALAAAPIGASRGLAAEKLSPATIALFDAVRTNDLAAVKRSLLEGADVRALNVSRRNPIDLAVDKGYFPIAHYLLAWRKQRTSEIQPVLPAPPRKKSAAPPEPKIPSLRFDPEPPPPAASPAVSGYTLPEVSLPSALPAPAASPAYTLPEVTLPSALPAPAAPAVPEPPSPITVTEPAPPSPVSGPAPGPQPWAGWPQQVIPEPRLPAGEPEPPPLPVIDQTGSQQAKEAEQETGTGFLDSITGMFGFGRDKDTAIKPQPAPPKPQSAAPTTQPATGQRPTEMAARLEPVEKEPVEKEPVEKKPGPPDETKDGGGVFNTIAEFFSSEPEPAGKPLQPQQAPTPPVPSPTPEPEPRKTEISETPAPAPPPVPEPAPAKAEPEPEKAEILKAPAPAPEPEPEKAETPDPPAPLKPAKPEDRETILARISDLLSSSPGKEPPPSSRDKAVAAVPSPAAEMKPEPPPLPPSPPEATAAKSPKTRGLATEPYLGSGLKLGNPRNEKSGETCVRKKTQGTWYCIEAVDWEDEIGDAFQVHTTLYRGRKAIVRYVDGKATQFHALFPKGNFRAIVRYFTKRFGPPSERLGMPVAMLGEPNRENKIVQWAGPATQGGGEPILEVREVDDLRWSAPPDARHGVVRLFLKGADPVFKHVSWSDFLLARIRERKE